MVVCNFKKIRAVPTSTEFVTIFFVGNAAALPIGASGYALRLYLLHAQGQVHC